MGGRFLTELSWFNDIAGWIYIACGQYGTCSSLIHIRTFCFIYLLIESDEKPLKTQKPLLPFTNEAPPPLIFDQSSLKPSPSMYSSP